MACEPEIIVHNREQLIALLTEAGEIEHGLMCCYLYAAFSIKTSQALAYAAVVALTTSRSVMAPMHALDSKRHSSTTFAMAFMHSPGSDHPVAQSLNYVYPSRRNSTRSAFH